MFSNMMSGCDLIDIDTIGDFFTWRKNIQLGGHVRKKLDRCLADVDWRIAFPHALVEVLPCHDSDHNPLFLSYMKSKTKKANSFHFQAAWISHPAYESLVKHSWQESDGNAILKLDGVQRKSIIFNRVVFGNIFKSKRILEGRIKGVHRQLDIHPSYDLIRLERDLQCEYNKVLAHEEMLWYQKSRENWVKFSNKNTKFFHTQTVIRRRRNKVAGLFINDIWCTDEETLKREAQSFFKSLFQSNDPCHPQSLQEERE